MHVGQLVNQIIKKINYNLTTIQVGTMNIIRKVAKATRIL